MTFRDAVLATVQAIPAGEVMTYGEVARAAGRPGAARAVGAIMRANTKSFVHHAHDPTATPCHRVVAAGRRLGGFNSGTDWKSRLLEAEGWQVAGNRLEHR